MVGRAIWEVLGSEAYTSIAPEARLALSGERVSFEHSLAIGPSERWFKFEYTPDFDESGATVGIYTMGIDITNMKEAQQRLSASARIDERTGLPNRAQLYERLTEAIAKSELGGHDRVLVPGHRSLQTINDSLGHAGGGEALREFGRRLKSTVRESDLVARLAGDEFVIVVEGVDQPDSAQFVAGKVIEAMQPPFVIADAARASTSIGVAMSDAHGDDADELLKRADEALYRVKRAGRGGFATGSDR